MLILSRVCAEFHDEKGQKLFTITPATRNTFVEAPEAIRRDPLFRMLLEERSLEASVPVQRQKELENDPEAGADAAGRLRAEEPSAPPSAEAPAAEAPPRGRKAASAAAKA